MPVARPAIVNRLHHTPWPSWVADWAGAGVRDAPGDAEQDAAGERVALGSGRLPGDRLGADDVADAHGTQHAQADEGGHHRRAEEQEQVRLLEEEGLADDVGRAHPRP